MAKLKILEELERLWGKVTNNSEDIDNLADEVVANTETINTINNKHKITSYGTLTDLGLTDAQFEGLTQVQAFDLLIEAMPYHSYLQCRLTSTEHTFRMAIAESIWGQVGTGWLRVDVTSSKRYRAEITDETDASLMFSSVGYPTYSSVWNKEVNENILNTRGYLTTKRIFPCDTATLNGLIDNGKYSVNTSEVIDGIPIGWYNVDITHHGATGHCTQVLKRMGNSDASKNGEVYIRTLISGSIITGGSRWDTKKLVTQTKTEITSDMLKNGWTIVSWGGLSCVVTGDSVAITGIITGGDRTAGLVAFELPSTVPKPSIAKNFWIKNFNDGFDCKCTVATDGSVKLSNFSSPSSINWLINISW